MFTHPLVALGKKVTRSGRKAALLPNRLQSLVIDINYAFAEFGEGKKTEANFRRLERRIDQLKIKFDNMRLEIELHLSEIEAADAEISSYLRPSQEERELMGIVQAGCAELSHQLSSWLLKIDDAVSQADLILAECCLEVPNVRTTPSAR